MANQYFDRYKEFRVNGGVKPLPFIKIEEKPTDKRDVYRIGKTRLDKLSQKFYNVPYYGFLILSANPQFGGLEFKIPDETILIIPFPLNESLGQYEAEIAKHKTYYGD